MSADLAARLRVLAQDHHAGKLNLEAYRKLRAPLLDSLQLHAMDEMAVTQPRSLGRAAGASPQVTERAATPAPRSTKRPRIIIAAIALLLIAGAAWWALQRPSTHENAVVDSSAPANPVHDVVAPFVQRGDWGDARVAALNVSLLELGELEIGAVAGEPWFQRFVDDLRKRFKEQQALVQTPLTAKSSPLAALAVTVGLDLNSPDAAIRITAIDPMVSPAVSKSEQSTVAASPAENAPHASTPARSPDRNIDSSAPKPRADSAIVSKTASAAAPITGPMAHPNSCRRELIRSRRPFCFDLLPSGKSGPPLALIPAGEFDMGSNAASTEQPIHRITIREPFAISVHEVSQAEFRAYCEDTGRSCGAQPWSGDDYPVVNVSWDDARAYVEWLSRATGSRYRLPSEAQWEYAARAGQTGLVPRGDTLSPTDAHYSMLTTLTAPAPRSQKFNDNAFRLVHTLGNLREWVEDGWVENYHNAPSDGAAVSTSSNDKRVARGGSYADMGAKLRLSMREGLSSDTRDALTGFRVLREVP